MPQHDASDVPNTSPDFIATPALTLPSIARMENKFYTGANEIDAAGCQLCYTTDFEEAFETPYPTDSHFVQYELVNAGLDRFPRLNKPVLSKLRERGCDVMCNMLVLDYDNPGHAPWAAGQWGNFERQLTDMSESWPTAFDWTILYGTKNGARFVYVLDKQVPVDKAEGHHIWLCEQFTAHGLHIPLECSDWTRLFRLPWVTRDGVQTWDEPYAEVLRQYEKRLPVASLGTSTRPKGTTTYTAIVPITDPKPTDTQVENILTKINHIGRRGSTEFYKEAKRRLKGRDCFACLFDNQPLAPVGKRSSKMQEYVGFVIGHLWQLPLLTPAHIYALFHAAAQQLDPAPDTPDWTDFLWQRCVCRAFALERAKVADAEKKKVQLSESAKTTIEKIACGMRKWCNNPALNDDREEVVEAWVSQHLICGTGQNFMVMQPNGCYDPMQVRMVHLAARIVALGMGECIQLKEQTESGGLKARHIQNVINDHCTIVSNIRAMPEIEGAFIEDIDTPGAQVVIPAYHRTTHLEAVYNTDVDIWLRKLFGPNYDLGIKWIGWALAWDEGPICALSIAGKAGSGKKMLAQGLCECLRTPKMATTEDLTGNYGYGLFQSPFLVVNEGWPRSFAGMHPADKFRALVSGDVGKIRKMYQDPVEIKSPVRVLFTANNLEVVKMLAADRDLSPDDRDALAIRLLHLSITEEASEWFKIRGGTKMTQREGHRWIAGDGGEQSDFVVAKHFMWLYAQRKLHGPVGARFLVEGNYAQQIMFDMRTGSGNSPLVIETLIRLIGSPTRHRGIVIEEGELYVTHDTILTFFREEIAPQTKQSLSSGQITKVITGLVKKETTEARIMKSRPESGRLYWRQIDCEVLLEIATREGIPAVKLAALVDEQRARRAGEAIANPLSITPNGAPSVNVLNFVDALTKKVVNPVDKAQG